MEIVIELRFDGRHYEELYRIPVGPSFEPIPVDEFRLLVWTQCYNKFPYMFGSYMGHEHIGLAIDPNYVGRSLRKAKEATEDLVEFLAGEYAR